MKSKQELEEYFEWWITCIPDKIDRLEELIPKNIYIQLDYTIDSFNVLGNYILTSTSIEELQKNKELWDCYASYIGTTYRRNVPSTKWFIELEDQKNIYYGVPSLKTEANTTFVPLYEITTMLDRKRVDFLVAVTQKHIQLQTQK